MQESVSRISGKSRFETSHYNLRKNSSSTISTWTKIKQNDVSTGREQHEESSNDDINNSHTISVNDLSDQSKSYGTEPYMSYAEITHALKQNALTNNMKTSTLHYFTVYTLIAIIVTLASLHCLQFNVADMQEQHFMEELKQNFSCQDPFLWVAFESGLNDVVTRNRPSVFVLLYENKAEMTLNKLIKSLSRYAVCEISACSKSAIVLTSELLNSPEVVNDYGIIIEAYKKPLEEQGVMIVKHFEKVSGISAQAFHSFCDEFGPLVKRSLFIFTMEVETFEEKNVKFVDEYFKKRWTNIKEDAFHALITRMTGMVIKIVPEINIS